MINENKKLLRKKYREIRNSIKDADTLSEDIYHLLVHSNSYENADIILVYWSTDSEVKTQKLIYKALSDNKKVALPKCCDNNGNMKFYYINSVDSLAEGMYGIMEPCTDNPADEFTCKSLCIVPALSFDKDGYRLGYGKGYYDRFLSGFAGVSIGLCYNETLVDCLPRNEFDKKVDYLITNMKIYDLR